jgi:hypothetical protein
MKTRRSTRAGPLLGLLVALTSGACAAVAVGAAAGAAGAIAYTQRGAETNLDATLAETVAATEAVFAEMDIVVTERNEKGDTEVQLTGETGDTEVVVDIGPGADGLTYVHVSAKEDVVDYDPDQAEEILRRIVQRA